MLRLRELTPDEIEFVSGGTGSVIDPVTGDSIVTGIPWSWGGFGSSGGAGYDGWDTGNTNYYDPGGAEEPLPPAACPCAGMTAVEMEERAIDAAAAAVLAAIQAMPNQALEYGSLLYRDASGQIRFTPPMSNGDYRSAFDLSALPANADGTPNYTTVVGFVHSHPNFLTYPLLGGGTYLRDLHAEAITSGLPDYLLVPSPDHFGPDTGVLQGDWQTWDSIVANILYDGGSISTLRQYIAGYDGTGLQLREYNAADRNTTNASDGEVIGPALAPCTCP